MPSHDDSALERDFDELRAVLRRPDRLNPAHSDPMFYFVYRPEYMLTVKRKLAGWMGKLQIDGFEPVRVSLSDIVRELIDASGRWEAWLEVELDAEPGELNEEIRSVLAQNNALVNRLAERIAVGNDKTVILLTEVELMHPYFRIHLTETPLIGRVPHPTVVFYPGRRISQYNMRFLGIHPEDPNYRSTIVGGLE